MATIRRRGDRWHAQVRRQGCQATKSFINRKDAEAWTRQTEIQADRKELPHDPRQLERHTLGELVIRYRDMVTPHKRAAKVETIVLNAFLRHSICAKKLSDLSPGDFAAYRDERLKEVKAYSLKRMLSPIQNLFEVAKTEWGLPIKENPISKLKIVCLNNRRERRLREGELERIKQAANKTRNPIIIPIILFALETGLRRSEILAAMWGHLDVANRVLSVPRAKNGHPRAIPLTLPAIAILQNLVNAPHSYHQMENRSALPGLEPLQAVAGETGRPAVGNRIFPTTANAFRLSWERLIKRAGIDDLHFHDLRHEAISRFFEMGLTAPEVALLSGHRDMRMLFRYSHPQNRRVLEQMDRAHSPD